MGSAPSTPVSVECPQCNEFTTTSGQAFAEHLQTHHGTNLLKCPKCTTTVHNPKELIQHFNNAHKEDNNETNLNNIGLGCPKCNLNGFADTSALVEHVQAEHTEEKETAIDCPRCTLRNFASGAQLEKHLRTQHNFTSQASLRKVKESTSLVEMKKDEANKSNGPVVDGKKLPHVGDKIMALYGDQYFPGTIAKFNQNNLTYDLIWEDGELPDKTRYDKMALDRVPGRNEIGLGSTVLFMQGEYVGESAKWGGGQRWHQGRITKIYKSFGKERFDGHHLPELIAAGKWTEWSGFHETFEGYTIDQFRVAPNVFDIMEESSKESAATDGTGLDDVDIFFSYSKADSCEAIKNGEAATASDLSDLCDPHDIVTKLRDSGLKVHVVDSADISKTSKCMKQAKVFIACISDEYVKNDQCLQEFQYAKTTLRKPVVPLVVGDGSFDWQMSVVGFLIAGDLYIHFKNKSAEQMKAGELMKSLSAMESLSIKDYVESETTATDIMAATKLAEADVFISYCWTNSTLAEQAEQIPSVVGHEFTDPRLLKERLAREGFGTWLDVEQLQSGDTEAGLFEQLTVGLKKAKVVVAFISDEYSKSANCLKEFKFALTSLRKPLVPVLVGVGDEWETSDIGELLKINELEPIDIRGVASEQDLQNKMPAITREVARYADRALGGEEESIE